MIDSKLSTSRLVGIYASLTILAVAWGNAFIAIRHALQFMTPVELAAARFLPVIILMGGWLLATDRAGAWQLLREEWPSAVHGAGVHHRVSPGAQHGRDARPRRHGQPHHRAQPGGGGGAFSPLVARAHHAAQAGRAGRLFCGTGDHCDDGRGRAIQRARPGLLFARSVGCVRVGKL